MKKLIIIVLIVIVLGAIAIPLYISSRTINETEDDGKDVVQAGSLMESYKGKIVYARYGMEKGLYSVSIEDGKKRCLVKGNFQNVSSGGEAVFFTGSIASQAEDKGDLHCLSMDDGASIRSFGTGGSLTERAAISPDGSMAVYVIKKSNGNSMLYSMSIENGDTQNLGVTALSITDVSFMNSSSLIYSKLITINGVPVYQLYSYSFNTGTEKRLHSSNTNDINPVVSPDGRYVAFLSLVSTSYSPCVIKLGEEYEKQDRVINNDIVLGGTLKWSSNSRYLLYTSVEYSSEDVYSVKVVDTASACKSRVIGSGYVGSFSPDGTAVVFASYSHQGDSKMQTICIGDIEGTAIKELIALKEYGCYAKSISVLEWIE